MRKLLLLSFNSLFRRVTSVLAVTKAFISGFQTRSLCGENPAVTVLPIFNIWPNCSRNAVVDFAELTWCWCWLILHPINPRQQPRAGRFPCIAPAHQAEGCMEGPSLAKCCLWVPGCKGGRCRPQAQGFLGWSWKSDVVSSLHPAHPLRCCCCWRGLQGARHKVDVASAPSAAGKLSGKIRDSIAPTVGWNPGQTQTTQWDANVEKWSDIYIK